MEIIKTINDMQKANIELEKHLQEAEDLMRQIKKAIPEEGSGISHSLASKLLLAIRTTREEAVDFLKSKSFKNLRLAASIQKKYKIRYLLK